jgi:TPR repeat protein
MRYFCTQLLLLTLIGNAIPGNGQNTSAGIEPLFEKAANAIEQNQTDVFERCFEAFKKQAPKYLNEAKRNDSTLNSVAHFLFYAMRDSLDLGAIAEEQVVDFIRKGAEKNLPDCNYFYGAIFHFGMGVPVNYDTAQAYYRKAISAPGGRKKRTVLTLMGSLYDKSDRKEALKYYLEAANMGYNEAQYFAGTTYYNLAGDYESTVIVDTMMRSEVEVEGREWEQESLMVESYAKAAHWFTKAAEQAYVLAYNYLGVLYQYGYGVEKKAEMAVKWYLKAAQNGDDFGQYNLAQMYQTGEGVALNYSEAIKWYKMAADKNNAGAMYQLGNILLSDTGKIGDVAGALTWYEKAASLEYDFEEDKMLSIAKIYAEGAEDVSVNKLKAMEWYEKAAQNNNTDAQNQLAAMYYNGAESIEVDYGNAFKWTGKAAASGDAVACYNMGHFYEQGLGTDKDLTKAAYCFERAAEYGLAEAQVITGNYYAKGVVFPKSDAAALYWYERAFEQSPMLNETLATEVTKRVLGETVALPFNTGYLKEHALKGKQEVQLLLAYKYASGSGVERDDEEAAKWYRMAADAGMAEAQYSLAELYQSGRLKSENSDSWLKWYTLAAQNGYAEANKALGDFYSRETEGKGIPGPEENKHLNFSAALNWYEKFLAMVPDHAEVCYILGKLYYLGGYGLEKNYKKAFKYLSDPLLNGDTNALYLLGTMYETGNGVPQDDTAAFEKYGFSVVGTDKPAADDAYFTGAYFRLGRLYYLGKGVTKNPELAISYLTETLFVVADLPAIGKNEIAQASYWIGDLILSGVTEGWQFGILKKYTQSDAINYLEKACNEKWEAACIRLKKLRGK